MKIATDIVVAEGRYLLANTEVVTLRRCGEAYSSIPTYTCDKYPSHRWYSGGWVVKPCPNFYDYYPEDDPNWVAVPELYVKEKVNASEKKNASTRTA